jgi:hypothetical protein
MSGLATNHTIDVLELQVERSTPSKNRKWIPPLSGVVLPCH